MRHFRHTFKPPIVRLRDHILPQLLPKTLFRKGDIENVR
jgi:hypothetical protein